MDKTKKSQAEKLQIKLDKLLQAKEKRQAVFEKSKQELTAITKEVDSIKFKLFEILQSGSDDVMFSNWAKQKIGESGNFDKNENADSAKTENGNSAKLANGSSAKSIKSELTEKSLMENNQPQTGQHNQSSTQ